MRIAVLSDTHDHCPPGLLPRLQGADEIWHLGDVCEPHVLAELESVGAPLRVVQGNCDWFSGWPLFLDLERGGVRFHLVHIPPPRAPRDVQVLLHGHTHVPRDEVDARGVRWLNPGCISRPKNGAGTSFAWLTFDDRDSAPAGATGAFRWQVVRL